MKAIQTFYKGYHFRSRLEARWAVFFDRLGIKWSYEHEGYRLADGTHYLPDFWLPTFDGGMFVEVKADFSEAEKEKCRQLCLQSGKSVMLAEGTPDFRVIYFYNIEANGEIANGLPNADQAQGENRMFVFPGYEDHHGIIHEKYYDCIGPDYVNAVHSARSARFEHGQSGSTN